jgi:hypothetical protein
MGVAERAVNAVPSFIPGVHSRHRLLVVAANVRTSESSVSVQGVAASGA